MIDIWASPHAVIDLEPAWRALAADCGNPFLQHDCAAAAAEAFAPPGRLRVFVGRRRGAVCGIAPFVLRRRGGLERLEPLCRPLGEPDGLLFADGLALRDLMSGILTSGWPIRWGRLAQDGAEESCLRDLLRLTPAMVSTTQDASRWLPLDDPSRLTAGLSRRVAKEIRHKTRRAESLGPVEFQAVVPDAGNVDAVLRQAYAVEAAGWKGRNGTALLTAPRYEAFFTAYCRRLAEQGRLRVFFLRIGEAVAAMRLAVVHDNRLWGLKIGYDERFRACSPGVLLTHQTLLYGCDLGLAAYEFLGQAEPWQALWGGGERAYVTATVHPRSVEGVLALSQDVCWNACKSALRALQWDRQSRKHHAQAGRPAAARN